jgi:glycosyltransferase involved in cell wall biosynthesis
MFLSVIIPRSILIRPKAGISGLQVIRAFYSAWLKTIPLSISNRSILRATGFTRASTITLYNSKEKYFPRRINRIVKNLKPDIVFVQGLHTPLQLILLGVQSGKKTRIIAQHHAEKPSVGIKKYLQKLADRYVDAYLFASREMGMEWVEKGNMASANKLHEVMEVSSIFSPMDKAEAKVKTGVTGDLVFLWVGRLDANKDPLTVIRAVLKFVETKPSARLYMIYHTDELLGEIQTVLNDSANKDAITLIGKMPHEELQYWYNSADIILSGSHYEGSGTAVCEAMSCRCMPVVTDILSFRMITDNGRCGLLYEAGDETSLLLALKLTCEIDLRKKQELSLQYFRETLSFEAIARKIQAIAESL